MALSLLRDWCRGLDVDMHRALLVTGIPEGLERAAIEAVLQPAFQPLGTFKLCNTGASRDHKAKAALVEFVEDINHAAVPREIPGKDGVWRIMCQDPAEDPGVLRQMRRLVLGERPSQAAGPWVPRDRLPSPASETRASGSEPVARRAGPPPRRGRQARRHRARGTRWALKGQKPQRGGWPPTWARRESDTSSEGSLGIVLEELDQDDLSADEAPSALSATLHQAAKELGKEWALQSGAAAGEGPREFLALVTLTDKGKREPTEKEPPGPSALSLDGGGGGKAGSGVPDLVALLAVRDVGDEEPADGDVPESESQPNGEPGDEGLDNPEFVAIVAYTDPSDPSGREELLKIASVVESLGWSATRDPTDALSEVLSVLAQDTGGARVKVEEAGRRVDALVLRTATDGGGVRECICALAAPWPRAAGKRARRGLLAGWGDGEGGLLELVALLAARDTAGASARAGGRGGRAGGRLGEVLALLAAGEGAAAASGSEAAAGAAQSAESEAEPRASGRARAKGARTASGALRVAAAAPAPLGSLRRRGGGGGGGRRAVTPETRAKDQAAAHQKKKGRADAGVHVQAGEARAQPSPGCESPLGRKARRGGRLPPKCR
ncbi:paraneoplastic antigen-like protein 8B [Ursus arctos]|uniref:paraneoplastic antigen-like protein 8B n=1 Tax=Ursus arctos TaxID=9644 RepID=UPI0020179849|nr:paraneoplastic antigen-like protein 8B [Ursus arctos]